MYMGILPVCYVSTHACLVQGKKRVLASLELELKTIVGCHVGAGGQTQVLWKSSQCSEQLSHHSSPQSQPFCNARKLEG